MVRTSHPNCVPAPLITIQQQLQSMAATMVDLMQQNQELIREVNRYRRQCRGEEHRQNFENEGVENGAEGGDHSRGTTTH